MTRIVQLLSHSIEAYDQLRLYTELGYEAVDIGGYIRPSTPHDDKRPALPNAPYFPELQAAIDALGTSDNLRAAQEHIPDAYLDWLGDDGVIIMHHYLERMIGDWPRLLDWKRGSSGRRIIWRSVGQSVEHNERLMTPLRQQGLERVAYSPKEANIPGYSGHDALIRFWKDPDEWYGWTGHDRVIANVTQHLAERDPFTNYGFWLQATEGLSVKPAGPGSESLDGGVGVLPYDEMRAYLRSSRAYLYTGTQPASYTLGLIEALMTGVPVVSIGASWMNIFPYGPELFEGWSLAPWSFDDPEKARYLLKRLLNEREFADAYASLGRRMAIRNFGIETIGKQWLAYLGQPALTERRAEVAVSA